MQSVPHLPAPWLANSAQEARAFDSVDDALAALSENVRPMAATMPERADLDAMAAALATAL